MTYVFVVGCPRSGTTWLQMLLAQHPAVTTTQETHLFDGYVAPLQDAWVDHQRAARGIGLQAAMTRAQFDALCAGFCRDVLARIGQRRDGTQVVLEKTPAHVRHVPLIIKLLPEARFIHLVRDPRAVVASLCAAGRSWGRTWASANPVDNARLWVSDVSAGRAIPDLTRWHYTLRYEDLRGEDGWRALQALFTWLGPDAEADFCRKTLADCAIDRLRNHSECVKDGGMISGDPAGFYRKGEVDSWSRELSPRDVRAIEYIADGLMQAYGYAASTARADGVRKPMPIKLGELLDGLEWHTRSAVAWGFDKMRRLT